MAGRTDHKWRAVTTYTGDDGLWITEPGFTSDAKTIVYVRGDGANRQGESPNPAQLQDGTDQAVFAVAVAGGAPKRLGPGNGAVTVTQRPARGVGLARTDLERRSGDGRCSRRDSSTRAAARRALSWSPDGSMLAFTSGRGTHSYIGVFTLASKELRYIDPSLDRDGNAVWSPDGSRIAWIRQGAAPRARMFSPRREVDEPWSLRVADVKTGVAKQVWKADAGYGSAFQGVVADSQLYWGAGDRLVFPWEKDGWLHLYSVPVSGGKATLLTPGQLRSRVREHRVERRENDLQLEPGRHRQTPRVDGAGRWLDQADAGRSQESSAANGKPSITSDGMTAMFHADAQHAAARHGDVAGWQRPQPAARTCCPPASTPPRS